MGHLLTKAVIQGRKNKSTNCQTYAARDLTPVQIERLLDCIVVIETLEVMQGHSSWIGHTIHLIDVNPEDWDTFLKLHIEENFDMYMKDIGFWTNYYDYVQERKKVIVE